MVLAMAMCKRIEAVETSDVATRGDVYNIPRSPSSNAGIRGYATTKIMLCT